MSAPTALVRRLPALGLLAAGVAAAVWFALGVGPSEVGWSALADVLSGRSDLSTRTILLDVRLPRVLLAVLVGAALSGAGAAFQGILRNPLADPYILGVSGGAALGAVLFIAFAGPGFPVGRPVAAFAGAVATLFVLFGLARIRGRTGTTSLLLVGVILNAFDSALILFLMTAGDPQRFQSVIFYLVGSIAPIPTEALVMVAVLVAGGLAMLFLLSHPLNLLALGEESASSLGVSVERTTWTAVITASLVTASAVAFTGLVGFVGLIVPHLARTVFGPDHRVLIPACVLGGAGFVVLADAAARTVAAPAEMPVGAITALVGGPFFLFLFLKRLRES